MKDVPTPSRLVEIRKKRRAYRLRVFILLLILILSIVFAMGYFSSDDKFYIKNIEISGNKVIENEDIENIIKKEISGKYFYLFSKSNSLIYPKRSIKKELDYNFPRIEDLSISFKDLNTIKIEIKERLGVYLYCGEILPLEKKDIGENCFFVNDDGYIFDEAPYYSGNIYFKFYLKLDDEFSSREILPRDEFVSLIKFINSIKDLGFEPIYITVENNGVKSLYLNNLGGKNDPKIIFNDKNDLDIIIENLEVSLREKDFKNEIDLRYKDLMYLDFRFDNKIIYKFDN